MNILNLSYIYKYTWSKGEIFLKISFCGFFIFYSFLAFWKYGCGCGVNVGYIIIYESMGKSCFRVINPSHSFPYTHTPYIDRNAYGGYMYLLRTIYILYTICGETMKVGPCEPTSIRSAKLPYRYLIIR